MSLKHFFFLNAWIFFFLKKESGWGWGSAEITIIFYALLHDLSVEMMNFLKLKILLHKYALMNVKREQNPFVNKNNGIYLSLT